jgi:hypothetical protein
MNLFFTGRECRFVPFRCLRVVRRFMWPPLQFCNKNIDNTQLSGCPSYDIFLDELF